VQTGELPRAIGEVHALAHEVMVEVLQDALREPGRHVEPEGVGRLVGGEVEDERGEDDAGLVGREEGLAAVADRQIKDVVRTETVEEARRLAAGHLDLAVVRQVEQGRGVAGCLIFRGGVAVMGRHLPAGLLGEDGPGLGGDGMQRGTFGHGEILQQKTATRGRSRQVMIPAP
jgi:hypothetical protein